MSVSLPGCPRFEVADIVRTTASSGCNVAAAHIEDTKAAMYRGQEGLSLPAPAADDSRTNADPNSYSLLIQSIKTALYHRAGALIQRRDCRQQAGIPASLSDVLFILTKESISSYTTSH
jgi:hypothetical protein